MRAWKLTALLGAGALTALTILRRKKRVVPHNQPEPELNPVDQAGLDSFPASDPPAWTLGKERT